MIHLRTTFLRQSVFCAVLCGSGLALGACDQGEDEVLAGPFEDGLTKDSSNFAFTVELSHPDGEPKLGVNTFLVRLAVPHPNDPDHRGWGIPGADIEVHAWMPNENFESYAAPRTRYLGDGIYEFNGIGLHEAGVWELEFDIHVGETIDEYVAFAFLVD